MHTRLLFGAGMLILLGAAIFFLFHQNKSTDLSQTSSSSPAELPKLAYKPPQYPIAPSLASPRTPPPGYREYRSEFYRFQFFYPESLTVKTIKEEVSAITLVFENADRSRTFQIFVTPYGQSEITEERMHVDIKSGTVEGITKTNVDGAEAIVFLNSGAKLGDMREIWFVHSGFLYEVTTFRELDEWITSIINSWMFLDHS